ncbi:hypothetical protein B0J12DRAFT_678892 [Macrophomina phaseolina]|uniref:Uncharacterized protein n=1 Tax=Macrophomina phaseolina TaxID=35725 RepID=A0ABQ8FYE3_9PEZI|nr:hypothetical protein B0J12DRAFT_678892 [Macrophomina phaseolina]
MAVEEASKSMLPDYPRLHVDHEQFAQCDGEILPLHERRQNLQTIDEETADLEPGQRYAVPPAVNVPHRPFRSLRQTPQRPPALAYMLVGSVMMITASMVNTFWTANSLPFCSRFWVLLGDEDECFWRPSSITILLACVAYTVAAIWLYHQSRPWRHRNITVLATISLGCGLSLLLGSDSERILRNTLPWSLFVGLHWSTWFSHQHEKKRRFRILS